MYFFLLFYLLILLYFTYKGFDKEKSDESYFFSSYKTNYFSSFISIFATETSVATLLIFPTTGYSKNFNIIFLCLGYIIGRIVVALYFLKHYHKISSLSLYEFITKKNSKFYLSFAYLIAKYISGSVRFYLAGFGLYHITNISMEFWLTIIILIVGIYSLTGGLKSVILTDQIQGLLIVIAGIFFIFKIHNSINIDIFQQNLDFDYKTSLYLFLGGFLLTLSSHGADQDILQRIFSVPRLKDAQKSLILSGFIASFTILIFFFIGYLLSFYSQLDPKAPLLNYIVNQNNEFIQGFFLITLMTASMSTLDSSIHSTGSIWKSLLFDYHKNLPNYFYSFLSLFIMYMISLIFVYFQTNSNLLSFALGMMNYLNGTLFSSITLFVIYKQKLEIISIVMMLITNVITTTVCEIYNIYFALTTIISFLSTIIIGFFTIHYKKK